MIQKIKDYIAQNQCVKAEIALKDLYTSRDFGNLARIKINDSPTIENFIKWITYIYIDFRGIYIDPVVHNETTLRGNIYRINKELFVSQTQDEMDLLAILLHEYYHQVMERILWSQTKILKQKDFTTKEISFIEDMYVNSWMRMKSHTVSTKWEEFLVKHDAFYNITFNEEEQKYNSLLTANIVPCNTTLSFLYNQMNQHPGFDFLNPDSFDYYVTYWNIVLKSDPHTKNIIDTIEINNKEDHVN